VVNQHLGDRAVEPALRVRRLIDVVRVEARPDHDLIQSDLRLQPVALTAFESIEKNFRATLAYFRADCEGVKIPKRTLRGVEESGRQQVSESGRACGLHVQHAEFFGLVGTE